MRPITVLTGIIMGSCGSIFLGTAVTLVIFLFLGTDAPRLQHELGPLATYVAIFAALTVLSAWAFLGQLLIKSWRWWAQGVLVGALVATVFYLLP